MNKIKQNANVTWKYVPTKQNPADIGSRGLLISKMPNVWWEGPSWLTNSNEWPTQPVIQLSVESQKEAKPGKQILANTVETTSTFDTLLEKFELHKVLRVTAWVNRFIQNCRHSKESGPLKTSEIEKHRKFYIKSEQKRLESSDQFQEDRKCLNLVQNSEVIYECRG